MNIITPEGPSDADIVILGESPGDEENLSGKPFVGPAGRLLFDQILTAGGLRRSDCLVSYVHWQMPPGRKWETIPEDDLGMFDTKTLATILRHPRKAIVAVGPYALDFLLKGSARVLKDERVTISKWRGSILMNTYVAEGTPVIPMIHPASVLRSTGYKEFEEDEDISSDRGSLHYKALCQLDARRVAAVVNDSEFRPPKRTIHHAENCSWAELMSILDQVERLSPESIAFDIETFAHTITCTGIAWNALEAVVIPFTEVSGWTILQRQQIISRLMDLLSGLSKKIGQNLDYDVQHLAQVGIPVTNVWLDTAVAHSILYPEIPHDLGMLTSIYTLEPFFKDMRKEVETADYDATQWTYNGLDCCVTWEIGHKLYAELEATKHERT